MTAPLARLTAPMLSRLMQLALLALLALGSMLPAAAQVRTLSTPTAEPTQVRVGVASKVRFWVDISDPNVLATGVNLLKVGAVGTNPTIVGVLKDDGTGGDQIAGDGRFSLELSLTETVAKRSMYRISAAFKGALLRVVSTDLGVEAVANRIPVAVPGADQGVRVGASVQLDGRESYDRDGDLITFRWTLMAPTGSVATLDDPTLVRPSFTPDVAGSYTARLVVNDGQVHSVPQELSISAYSAGTVPPTAVIAGSLVLPFGTGPTVAVPLSGIESFDPDGDTLTYSWQLVGTPALSTVATLTPLTGATPILVADKPGRYVVELWVTSGSLDSAPVRATITLYRPNSPPVVDAGGDKNVSTSTLVTLGATVIDPDSDALVDKRWAFVARPTGSAGVLNSETILTPSFTADVAGDYLLELVVTDARGAIGYARILVRASGLADADQDGAPDTSDACPGTPANTPVNADGCAASQLPPVIISTLAATPASGTAPLTVGFASQAAGGTGSYAYGWTFGDAQTSSAQNPLHTYLLPNTYTATVTATDTLFSTGQASATITVNPAPMANAGPDQTVPLGTLVRLNGSSSQDPKGGGLTYTWSLLSKPAASSAVLTNPLHPFPEFTADAAGTYVAQLIVSDGKLDSAPDTVTVEAISTNQPPTITSTPVTSAIVGILYSYDVVATDPDAGDTLTFSLDQAPAGMTINSPAAGSIRWTPTAAQGGSQRTVVKVIDNRGAPDIQNFDIQVTDQVTVLVPNVMGQSEAQATADISGAGLVVGAVTRINSDTIPQGSIISQNPVAGVSLAQGAAVDLVVSLGPSVPPPINGVLLEGPPDALAMSALNNLDLLLTIAPPVIEVDQDGVRSVRNRFFMGLKSTALVGEVNALLQQINGRIAGMIGGVPWVIIDIPDPGSRTAFEAILVQVGQSTVAEYVVSDALVTGAALPAPYDASTLGGFSLIDHLITVGAPAAWNARNALVRTPMTAPEFLVADFFGDGPPQYPPFGFDIEPNDFQTGGWMRHGYAVLSTMGADFGADPGSGLLPTGDDYQPRLRAVDLRSDAYINNNYEFYSRAIIKIQNRAAPMLDNGRRIILNTSLQFICRTSIEAQKNCSDDPSLPLHSRYPPALGHVWLDVVRTFNLEERMLHVTAAGNYGENGIPARLASPFTAAALLPIELLEPLRNTLVVGNVVADAAPPYPVVCGSYTSSLGGNIAAVGTAISAYGHPDLAPVHQIYSLNGTSFASPQVAALGYYVWALNDKLTAVDVAKRLIDTARSIAPQDVNPLVSAACNPTNYALEPVINAYSAILSVDKPSALAGAGSPTDAPVRLAIVDVANSSGAEGGDGAFDQGDLMVLKDKIIQGVNVGQSNCTGYDWSRYDLSGEGHTGADWGSRFNLNISRPAAWTPVTAPDDSDLHFNERCATDLQVLCYYAYSPLYKGSTSERDNLLRTYCGHGQKTWSNWPQFGDPTAGGMKLGADGRGNVFALWFERNPDLNIFNRMLVGKVDFGGVVLLGAFELPQTPSKMTQQYRDSTFFVDKLGNIIVVYEVETGIWCQPGDAIGKGCGTYRKTWAQRYNSDRGWDNTPELITGPGIVEISGDSCCNAMIVWQSPDPADPNNVAFIWALHYDASQGWRSPTQIARTLASPYRPKIAMDLRGRAIVVWSEYDVTNRTREIWAKRYRVDSGWDVESKQIIAGQSVFTPFDIVMDPMGNAIVTWYSTNHGMRARHFDINTGWQPVLVLTNNLSILPEGSDYASESNPVYKISMDECGNAMVVYRQLTNGQESLLSKGYSADRGWDDNATIVSNVFDEPMAAFSMHGGGNATLISGYSSMHDLIWHTNVYARQYRIGKGWGAPAFYEGEYGVGGGATREHTALARGSHVIDGYGNATGVNVWVRRGWELFDSIKEVVRFE